MSLFYIYTQHQFTFPRESYRQCVCTTLRTNTVCHRCRKRFSKSQQHGFESQSLPLFFGVTCKQITNTLKPKPKEYRVLKAVCLCVDKTSTSEIIFAGNPMGMKKTTILCVCVCVYCYSIRTCQCIGGKFYLPIACVGSLYMTVCYSQ